MKTYDLKHPITFRLGGNPVEVTKLELRRLNGSDMRIIDTYGDKPMALTLALIDRVASPVTEVEGLPNIDLADKLDVEDVQGVGEWLAPMLNFSPQIGVNG